MPRTLAGFIRALTWGWTYEEPPSLALRFADAIVTQSCSRKKDESIAHGNELLARTVRQLHRDFPTLGIYAQHEVALAAPELHYTQVVSERLLGKTQLDTRDVAAYQATLLKSLGTNVIIVVAAPVHMGRALMTYRLLGLTPIPAPGLPRQFSKYSDTGLVHWSWGKGRTAFMVLREVAARLLFWWKGYI